MNEEETFVIESASPNERYVCVFEDDGETGYVYFCPLNDALEMEGVADALWIYDQISPPIEACEEVGFAWNDRSSRVAFIVDGECWGMLDLATKRKMTAPREDNAIVSLSIELWEAGIPVSEGEPLQMKVER
ncbi:MAG: DUF2251 domain-containing protein [Exiguobacterium sp.]|uniref:DUF2251 domain-containing protein n=1 Tax=Exiguobacterium sp. AB2 TaxID=1484479 RepID=UPI0004A897AF|nr:DUF2251 domain-containing protein [Exiguobacterium sp. AB2]KDN57736.1 hypothetical protein DI14_07165 [Exiguobacterium sp. AB2]MDX5324209.1 DUF2251 domain-containing protein [Exiguobacterium sp.]MDX5426034.1 DUF2251 domain-containing protein [Exiguobacterium sp.]MDX6773428.1 DUF2251 domain-containing protein [Exiguobacterium sp.]